MDSWLIWLLAAIFILAILLVVYWLNKPEDDYHSVFSDEKEELLKEAESLEEDEGKLDPPEEEELDPEMDEEIDDPVPTAIKMTLSAANAEIDSDGSISIHSNGDVKVNATPLADAVVEEKKTKRKKIASKQKHAKFSKPEILAIRRAHHGVTDRQLAEKYGVSKSTIGAIRRHETYRNVR